MSTRSSRRRPVASNECFNLPTKITTRKRLVKQKENFDETDNISEASLKLSPVALSKVPQSEKVNRKRNVLKEQNISLQTLDIEDKTSASSDAECDVIKPRKGRSRKTMKNDEEKVNDSVACNHDLIETSKKKKKKLKRQSAVVTKSETELSEDDAQANINSKKGKTKTKKGTKEVVTSLEFESDSIPQKDENVEKPTKKSKKRRNYVSLIETEISTSEQSDSKEIQNESVDASHKKGKKAKKIKTSGTNNIIISDVDEVDSQQQVMIVKKTNDGQMTKSEQSDSKEIQNESVYESHKKVKRAKKIKTSGTNNIIISDVDGVDSQQQVMTDKRTNDESSESFHSAAGSPIILKKMSIDSCIESKSPDKRLGISIATEKPALKREGTFTKETNDETSPHTPEMIKESLSAPGSTPYHPNGLRVTRNKYDLNRTHSIEKRDSFKRSMSADDCSKRQTKVMFCDPISGEKLEQKRKSKIIKSSLKGSNKTFVYGDEVNITRRESRKRSFTHNDVEEAHKKKRLTIAQLTDSANRLSKPKKLSLSAKKLSPRSRSDAVTPSTSNKKTIRSKLPDFASLHKKQFEKMESLGECQERKARRALQLLGSAHAEKRRSPRGHAASSIPKLQKENTKITLPAKKKPTMERRSVPTALNFKEKTLQMKPNFKQIKNIKEKTSIIHNTVSKIEEKRPQSKKTVEDLKAKGILPAEKNSLNKQLSQSKERLALDKDKAAASSYTRFGFKLDLKSNPFSIVKKTENILTRVNGKITNESVTNISQKQNSNKSGTTNKEKAIQSVMNDKSNLTKIKSNTKNIIKGVRMNRRFELQMKMRNVEG